MIFSFRLFQILLFLILSVALATAAPTTFIPQTGQSACWSLTGEAISCAATGQDADLLVGMPWPAPRFSDNGDGTITDSLTGLIWSKDANPAGTANSWQQALDYIKTLNNSSYLGKNDWRLPNRAELLSLVNPQQPIPADWLNDPAQGFSNAQSDNYWSASSAAGDPLSAWPVNMYDGLSVYIDKSVGSYVWPVSGGLSGTTATAALPQTGQTVCWNSTGAVVSCAGTGQDGELLAGIAWPSPRFNDNGDQTMTDNLTGLVWSKDANPGGSLLTWQQALDYIKNLNNNDFLSKGDWRLPNRLELNSLVTLQQAKSSEWANSQGFINVQELDGYWSSTTSAGYTLFAGVTVLGDGSLNMEDKSSSNYVWPVRAGEYWKFESLLVAIAPRFGFVPSGGAAVTRQIEIVNKGTASLAITSLEITGSDANQFNLAVGGDNPCPSLAPTIAPGASCTLLLGFAPTTDGAKSAAFSATVNGIVNSIPISGTYNSTVFGTVTDSITNQPVSGATVTLNTSATTTTGTDGKYSFGSLAPATYGITISKDGYQNAIRSGLTIAAATSARADVQLAPIVYTLTFLSSGNGTVDGTTPQIVTHGGSAETVIAMPATDYHFVNWTGTGGFPDTTDNPLSVVNVTADMTITANFATDLVSGSCGVSGGGIFTTIPATGLCASGTASAVSGTGPWSWTCEVPTGGQPVSCAADIQAYAVNFAASGNGTLTGNTSQALNHGATATAVEAVPAAGYHFVNWTGTGGFTETTDNPLTVVNVTADMNITASFASNPVDGFCGVSNGAVLTAAPATGLCASGTPSAVTGSGPWSWTCDGANGGQPASCSAEIRTYAVDFSINGNGTVTENTSQTVNHGAAATAVTAVPAAGYQFLNWTGTANFVTTATNPLTIVNVTAAMTVTANFVPNPVNGACGSAVNSSYLTAPATNLCSAGIASGVIDSGSWDWTCDGAYGGQPASCTAGKAVYPAGNVSRSGSIGIADALLVLQAFLGNTTLDPNQRILADVAPLDAVTKMPKGDGVVDLADAIAILSRAVDAVVW